MFDFLGLAWEYEPALDAEISGWLPDFVVGLAGTQWLVECKPALDHAGLEPARRKVQVSGALHPVLLLGARWGVALARTRPDPKGAWRPANLTLSAGLSTRAEPDETLAWWLRAAWVDAGNRTQWRSR